MKRRLTLLICTGVLLSLAAFVVWATSERRKQYQPGDVIDGRHSKVNGRQYHLVTGQQQWTDIWRRHQGVNNLDETLGTLPAIDFSRHIVVAIFLGETSQCMGITVQSLTRRETDDHLDIRYRPDWYSAEAESNEGLEENPQRYRRKHAATPFGFIIVRRVAKVSLFKDVQALRDAAPEYKIQTELSMNSPVVIANEEAKSTRSFATNAQRREERRPKGIELYSWKNEAGEWEFVLVNGTNRMKTGKDIKAAKNRAKGTEKLREAFSRLAVGESVSWAHHDVTGFEFPNETMKKAVAKAAKNAMVNLQL